MATAADHPWADRSGHEKRCTTCHTTAVRKMRPEGGWDVEFFSPDGTQLLALPSCGPVAPRPEPGSGRTPGLFYVYLAPGCGDKEHADAIERELSTVGAREHLAGWHVHRSPDFVSLRLTAASMAAAQAAARPLVTEAFVNAGLGEPCWRRIIAIPAGGGAGPRQGDCGRTAEARPTAPPALSFEAG
jgi:hypothetical protein